MYCKVCNETYFLRSVPVRGAQSLYRNKGEFMLAMVLVVVVLAVFLSFGSLRLFSIRKMEKGEKRDALVLSIVGGKLRQILKICKVELSVDGLDRIPEKEAVLFIGNHRSYFDIVVAYSILPRPTGFISKKEIAKIPNIELWMRELHCLFLDRENLKQNLQVIIEAIKQVKAGISMWIYPEGTRTRGESELDLGEFKAGSFKIAEKSGCKIVPVAMINTRRIMEEDFPRLHSAKVYVQFGKPIDLAELSEEDRKNIAEYTRERIREMLAELKEKEAKELSETV